MRSIAIPSLLLFVALSSSIADSASAVDPIFGLKYSSAEVIFPAAPDNLTKLCRELTNESYDRKLLIFAQTRGNEPHFLVIGGSFVKRGAVSVSEPDTNGAVLKLQGNSCEMIGAARDVFEYPPAQISQETVRALLNDAVCAYSRAFGSYKAFRAALRRQHSKSPSKTFSQAISKPNCS